MNLRRLIEHYYGGNRLTFRDAVSVSPKTVYRWLTNDAVVFHGKVYLPVRDIPELPHIAPDYRRDDFEAAIKASVRRADLSRVGEHYVCPNVQKMWQGWQLAQELGTSEALNA
ncbi:hypothetical protein EU642_22355 [Salmonella enterica]|nr:hypothetical protein [Salmonella enterica]EAO0118597.1 hypothetical protein [Salmonella enterica]EAO3601700.1 hypothetical protein [Salmonella enterica]EAR6391595.1 hypothetical protein [Salmonella enterica]EAV1285359.1 hypothetical protein [Salmonella enterica]